MGFNQICWDEAAVRALLNKLRDTEATPHKIQRIWDTLLLDVAFFGRLQEKRKALQDQLPPTVSKPQRKAMVPSKEVIWALECGAVGIPPQVLQALIRGNPPAGPVHPGSGPLPGCAQCKVQRPPTYLD